ncbi:purine and uridine phosphorylase [Colletotrichum falcatum]|nr:purine and uridine phosphorylase [Colletotrichum falcatum]
MSDPRKYTIGWICAIPTEFAAARAFLDGEHDEPEAIAQNDDNTYALGTMGKHNVVIAVMPKKEYGTTSAATVARDMVHSFPNLRIGLIVGVGGGAPSPQHDIRLGDVVVGSRGDGNSGVVQYDYGREIQNQEFTETGSLNQPPRALLNAVAGLETDYMMKGPELNAKVDKALSRWRRLQKTHCRPSTSADQLYRADFVHPPESVAACSQGCNADISNMVTRPERGDDEDNPAIHYGLIASANRVMKNAEIRDRLSKERGVLCFEMEAAGLMNHFPCLVVRGICDYSDSHKNKEWQGFAAMTAAAYAKDLLCRVSPRNIEAEKKIREVLGSSSCLDISLASLASDSHIQKIKTWLSPADTSINSNRARESRQKGTGTWFLESAAFQEWKLGSRRHLWLHGMPGSGKTVLSTTILDHLELLHDRVTLDFFFDFSDAEKQKPDDMCRSLAFQLYAKRTEARKDLDGLLASHDDGQKQPTTEALSQCLQKMMQFKGKVCIVLDALDECVKRTAFLQWMESFVSHSDLSNVQLIATGRPEDEFIRGIHSWIGMKNCVPLEKECVNSDIQSYIDNRLRMSKGFGKWMSTPSVLQKIQKEIGEKADGMFRWAACQLDSLETCLDLEEIETALKTLPENLNDTYTRIIQNIAKRHKIKAIRLLQFLAYAERPLTLREAIDAIAVRLEEERPFDPSYRMPNPTEIRKLCPGLAVLVETPSSTSTDSVLQLAHFTVKEYLLHHDIEGFREVEPSISISKTCLFYLKSVEEDQAHKMTNQFPLARYAAEIWMDHTKAAEASNDIVAASVSFLQNETWFRVWGRLFDPQREWEDNPGLPRASSLYYSCLKGLTTTTLLNKGADVNAQGGYYGNALQAASYGGHKNIVQMLLDRGANVLFTSNDGRTPLHAVSSNGHLETVYFRLRVIIKQLLIVSLCHITSTPIQEMLPARHRST